MGVTVTATQVKERCGITETTWDTEIWSLIDQMVYPINYAIAQVFLDDTGNAPLVATLNLAAIEIIAGEYFAQYARKPGVFDTVQVDRLTIKPYVGSNANDPSGLKAQGWLRLRPFLRLDPVMPVSAPVVMASGKQGDEEEA